MTEKNNNQRDSTSYPTTIRGIKSLAELLHVSVPTAQMYKNNGTVPYYQRGRVVLFDPEAVMKAFAANTNPNKKPNKL